MNKFAASLLVVFSWMSVCFADASPCAFCNSTVISKQCVLDNNLFRIITNDTPLIKGHLMIVPKRHISKAHELSVEEWKELGELVPKVVKVFQKSLNTDDYLLLEKNGPLSGQSVPHVHFHLIPMPTGKAAEQVKVSLLAKVYDISPGKLNDHYIKSDVAEFSKYFKEAAIK